MKMDKGIGGHHRGYQGKANEWLTPPEIVKSLGEFDLDPCSPIERPWPTAKVHFTSEDDGLSKPWFGRVWLNPPYGPNTGKWMQRLADHGNGIALIFARTETKFFQKWVWDRASALFFLFGRLHFHLPDGTRSKLNSGAPSVLVAYGSHNADWLKWCKLSGRCIQLHQDS